MDTVLIAGGTGLSGMRLSRLLKEKGYSVLHLSRKSNLDSEFPTYVWDTKKGTIDLEVLAKADYIINLAGAGIADGRWTKSRKELIISSRVESTLLFKKYLQETKSHGIKAYISASAIGFYGNRDEVLLMEEDTSGEKGFLPKVVAEWEQAIEAVAATGIRTLALRIGIVLSTQGGALPKMMLPLRFFCATYFGNGRQWYSWIHIDDLCRMYIHAIENKSLSGIYNAVSPKPERNKDFILTLKKALGKPAIVLPLPRIVLRTTMGELADVVLDSTKVSSKKIQDTGFEFQFQELLPALHDLLRKKI